MLPRFMIENFFVSPTLVVAGLDVFPQVFAFLDVARSAVAFFHAHAYAPYTFGGAIFRNASMSAGLSLNASITAL